MGWRVAFIACLLGLVLAGCGSSSSPSTLDPTPLAPASSVLYVDLAVRPQGSLHDSAESALTRLVGHSPDAAVQRVLQKLLRHSGLSWSRDVQPWLGEHIGLVATAFSRGGVALIAPTNDPGAAISSLKRVSKARLSSAKYAGVVYQQGMASGTPVGLGVVGGHDVVFGGLDAFKATIDAYHGRSIASAPGYSSVYAALPSNSLAKVYVNGASISGALASIFSALPGASAVSSQLESQLLGSLGRRLRGQFGFALALSPRSFTLDFRSTHARTPSRTADVSRLPGQSWLAISTGAFNTRSGQALLGAQLARNPFFASSLGLFRQRYGFDYVHDLLPALGPLQLAVQGTSPVGIGLGLALTPTDPAAAGRLLTAIYRLAARSSSLSVHGSPRDFLITKAGLPIPRVTVAQVGGRVLAAFDESFGALLAPSSALAANPDFVRARAGMPVGGRVPLYLNFRTLGQLLQNIPSVHSGRGQKLLSVVQRLDYLIVGQAPTSSEARITLALR